MEIFNFKYDFLIQQRGLQIQKMTEFQCFKIHIDYIKNLKQRGPVFFIKIFPY